MKRSLFLTLALSSSLIATSAFAIGGSVFIPYQYNGISFGDVQVDPAAQADFNALGAHLSNLCSNYQPYLPCSIDFTAAISGQSSGIILGSPFKPVFNFKSAARTLYVNSCEAVDLQLVADLNLKVSYVHPTPNFSCYLRTLDSNYYKMNGTMDLTKDIPIATITKITPYIP